MSEKLSEQPEFSQDEMNQLADEIDRMLEHLKLKRCITAESICTYLRRGELENAQIVFETDGDKLIQYQELNDFLCQHPMLKEYYRYR